MKAKPFSDDELEQLRADVSNPDHEVARLLVTLEERTRERDEARKVAATAGDLWNSLHNAIAIIGDGDPVAVLQMQWAIDAYEKAEGMAPTNWEPS